MQPSKRSIQTTFERFYTQIGQIWQDSDKQFGCNGMKPKIRQGIKYVDGNMLKTNEKMHKI